MDNQLILPSETISKHLREQAPLTEDDLVKIAVAHIFSWSEDEADINETHDAEDRAYESLDHVARLIRDELENKLNQKRSKK